MVPSSSGKGRIYHRWRFRHWCRIGHQIGHGGAEVWLADRHLAAAQELVQRLGNGGARAIELDVRSYPAFEGAVAEAVPTSEWIDYLFNNAGIGVGGEVDSYTLDD